MWVCRPDSNTLLPRQLARPPRLFSVVAGFFLRRSTGMIGCDEVSRLGVSPGSTWEQRRYSLNQMLKDSCRTA
ncbi:hypothetical protein RB10729 [Rhodopirellula baltica SH 1]|uniref:Uncharacterized protein n=1 Tax=Rhodopirellula baltica (strain DSM 10527 / NCIMB 13988 / SH1) TaxID=243090 RepID=Q7UKC3_RHOBA|nr:hypothetical protein RB10729 [Rhodopirellula baltica SH 1]